MILPSKITEDSWFYKVDRYKKQLEPFLGRYYISYSTSSAWGNPAYSGQLIRQKLMGFPFTTNVYSDFGNWVGESVEKGEIQKNKHDFFGEENIKKVGRPENAEYERLVLLDMGDFVFLGFIDIFVEEEDGVFVGDVKTGGKGKEKEYKSKDYTQVVLYAHALEQEGKKIKKTVVLFLEREGSHFNPPLGLTHKQTIIPIEYSKQRVSYALNKLEIAAREIAECYAVYNKYFKQDV